jgi:hypothetical protein
MSMMEQQLGHPTSASDGPGTGGPAASERAITPEPFPSGIDQDGNLVWPGGLGSREPRGAGSQPETVQTDSSDGSAANTQFSGERTRFTMTPPRLPCAPCTAP